MRCDEEEEEPCSFFGFLDDECELEEDEEECFRSPSN